jgi:hypothetical protein
MSDPWNGDDLAATFEQAEFEFDAMAAMVERNLGIGDGSIFGMVSGITDDGEWAASVTLRRRDWLRLLSALEGVDPDAIAAYLALGGS